MDTIEVRVGRVPGTVSTIVLNGTRDVRTALTAAGLSQGDYEIRVNSQRAELTTTLRQGDTVLLVKKITGNMIEVRVGRVPGAIQSIALDDGATVGDALEEADLDQEDYEVRVNSQRADLGQTLRGGETVLLVKKITGNEVVKAGAAAAKAETVDLGDGRALVIENGQVKFA